MSFKDRTAELARKVPQQLREPQTYVRGAASAILFYGAYNILEKFGNSPIASANVLNSESIVRQAGADFLSARTAAVPDLVSSSSLGLEQTRLAIAASAPESSAEINSEKPAKIDFELRVITRGSASAKDAHYKIQGNDQDTYYLYKVVEDQYPKVDHEGKPLEASRYGRNTEVVAKFVKDGKDDKGQDEWKREDLKQPKVIIEGKPNENSCDNKCPETTIFITEADSEGKIIPGGISGAYRNIKFIPNQVCFEWANFGYKHEAPTPTPTQTAEPTVTVTATATPTATLNPRPPLPRTGN